MVGNPPKALWRFLLEKKALDVLDTETLDATIVSLFKHSNFVKTPNIWKVKAFFANNSKTLKYLPLLLEDPSMTVEKVKCLFDNTNAWKIENRKFLNDILTKFSEIIESGKKWQANLCDEETLQLTSILDFVIF